MKSKLHEYKEAYETHIRSIKHPQPRRGIQFIIKDDGNLRIQRRGQEMVFSPSEVDDLMDVFKELGFGHEG